jgi:hypothetical protein
MAFRKGQSKLANSGRRRGTPNKATARRFRPASEVDDKAIVDKVIADAKDGDRAAQQIYFRHLRAPTPREPTFTPEPFPLRPLTTLKDASEETLRVAGAVAEGKLDHDTGAFLVTAIRAFVETLTVVKTEAENAAVDALVAAKKP